MKTATTVISSFALTLVVFVVGPVSDLDVSLARAVDSPAADEWDVGFRLPEPPAQNRLRTPMRRVNVLKSIHGLDHGFGLLA